MGCHIIGVLVFSVLQSGMVVFCFYNLLIFIEKAMCFLVLMVMGIFFSF